jgi:protein-S-isoprenylcysteine O-methyltransferase Ste14
MGLVAIGTGTFFLESLIYLLFGMFNGPFSMLALLDLPVLNFVLVRPAGALLMTAGYTVFIWSVLARGRYASSWTMSAKHRLVDWGPYRYVRHPSYLGYFLMFIGFFLLWHNLLGLVPLVGIPGYVMATNQEEEMLMKRFGQQYAEYRRRVGRFVPRIQLRKSWQTMIF